MPRHDNERRTLPRQSARLSCRATGDHFRIVAGRLRNKRSDHSVLFPIYWQSLDSELKL
jgi:hypothetical protein